MTCDLNPDIAFTSLQRYSSAVLRSCWAALLNNPTKADEMLRLLTIGLLLLLAGCATVIVRSPGDAYGIFRFHGVYPATRFEAELIGAESGDPLRPLLIAGAVLDLPLSALFDTLLVPYDLLPGADSGNDRLIP